MSSNLTGSTMYKLEPTRELVLSYLTEKEIMEHYLQRKVSFNRLIKDPLRSDARPTAGFYIDFSGRLIFKDFNGSFHGDCFEVVRKRNKNTITYFEAITKVYEELILGKELTIIPPEERVKYEPSKKLLQVRRRKLCSDDLQYWEHFGISEDTLGIYRVTGLDTLWCNGKIIYSSNILDTGYLYDFGEEIYKAYFPFRSEYRFITNASRYVLQGYNQLPRKGNLLIITKSLKDVMSLYELGFSAIAPQAESVLISKEQIVELKSRFKKVISVMDFDLAGIRMMNKLKRIYNIRPYTLTNGRFYTIDYGAKDISDYIKAFSKEEMLKLIENEGFQSNIH